MNSALTKVTLTGKDAKKVINYALERSFPIEDLREVNSEFVFYTSEKNALKIKKLCLKYECSCEIPCKKDTPAILKIVSRHPGFFTGLVISAICAYVFSGMILSIRIDNNSIKVRNDILGVLSEKGIGIGSYTDELEPVKLERELKAKVPGISWAGISAQGSTLIIDTIDNVPIPESDSKRLPCNVVALHDCVIDDVQVYNGDLNVSIGSGVRAGDIIISGVRNEEISTGKDKKPKKVKKYLRADGKVFGTFEKTLELDLKYKDTQLIPTGNTQKVKYIDIFGAHIPLFINRPEGEYSFNATTDQLTIFGFELPVAVTDVKYDEYNETEVTYSKDQLLKKTQQAISDYQNNFLKNYEIIDIKKNIKETKTGIKATVTFMARGEIGEQVDIFLNK